MTAPKISQQHRDQAVQTGNADHSTEQAADRTAPSGAASVAFIRNWPLSILSLCFFPLLLSLGNWQLSRAGEKQTIQDQIDGRLGAQPIAIAPLQSADSNTLNIYTPVRLLGFYTDEYFFLDNRTRNGRVGYEVLQIFETGSGDMPKARWLINRGWLPAGKQRDELPEVQYPLAAKVITGFLYPSKTDPQSSGGAASTSPAPHSRIQSLQALHPQALSLPQPDWHIRLSADSDTALLTDWTLVTTSPQKHTGYAVQWFSMAAALLVLWLLAATNLRQIVREKWFKKTSN